MKLRKRVRSTKVQSVESTGPQTPFSSTYEHGFVVTSADSLKMFIEQNRCVVTSNSLDECSVRAVNSRSPSVDSNAIEQKGKRTSRELRGHRKRKSINLRSYDESAKSKERDLRKEKRRIPAARSNRSRKRSQSPTCSKEIVAINKSDDTHAQAARWEAKGNSSRARSASKKHRRLSADLPAYRELVLKMEAVDGPQLRIILEKVDSKG